MVASIISIQLPDEASGRLDKVLAEHIPEGVTLSRTRLQDLIQSGSVLLGDMVVTEAKSKVKGGEIITIHIPPIEPLELKAQPIPLEIHFEDNDVLVVNKPAGMVVHPGTGVHDGTLVNAILHHCQETLSGIGGVERPGIVHRIDKDTSGLLVIAKNDRAHQGLGDQFRDHSIERRYQALSWGHAGDPNAAILNIAGVSHQSGGIRISGAIARHPHDRLRMAVREQGKHAVTHIRPIMHFDGCGFSHVECQLETGRTHQIRVHMTHIGMPLLGDPIYGRGARHLPKTAGVDVVNAVNALTGQALHAARLGFLHPITGEHHSFDCEPPTEFQSVLHHARTNSPN